MPALEFDGRSLKLNDEGYLVKPKKWDEDVARELARTAEGLEELTDDHWAVIRYIRDHFVAHKRAPLIRALCEETELSLKRIYQLFVRCLPSVLWNDKPCHLPRVPCTAKKVQIKNDSLRSPM